MSKINGATLMAKVSNSKASTICLALSAFQ